MIARSLIASVLVSAVLASSLFARPAHAGDMVGYEVTGEATESEATARSQALDQAFASAVERALADVLSPEMRRKHRKSIHANIVRRARLHVISYRVNKQTSVEGKLTLQVGVLIDRDRVREALGKLGIDHKRASATPAPGGRPKVVVLLHATVAGKTHVTYGSAPTGRDGGEAGRAFIAELKRRGFDVVASTGTPEVSRNPEPGLPFDDQAALAMALRAKAGGAFVVGIEVREGGAIRGTRLRGATGRAHLRLLDTAKGHAKVVARATVDAGGFGADAGAAAAHAATTLGGKAISSVGTIAQRHWPTTPALGLGTSDGLAIVVRGDLSWTAVTALLATLRAATDVSAAEARRFRPGEVVLVVRGPITNLAEAAAVSRAAAIVKGATITGYTVTAAAEGGNTLAVTMAAAKATP